jgi:ABC-type antimicrobial peptide transport system permease subunit
MKNMNPNPQPPKWAGRLLVAVCPPDLTEELLGDLYEQFMEEIAENGETKARRKYVIEVLKFVRPYFLTRKAKNRAKKYDHSPYPSPFFLHPGMLRNYLKIAVRNLLRRKVASIINITGLTLGVCACLMIFLITSFEFSFDKFHPENEHIYRVAAKMQKTDGGAFLTGSVPNPTAAMLRSEVAGLENVAGFFAYNATVKVPGENIAAKEFPKAKSEADNNIIVAEPQYFDIFKYEWLAGNAATALNEPFQVVLSKTEAKKYFGDMPMESIVGQQLLYNDSLQLTVSGIVSDWQENSDLDFKDFISWKTIEASFLKEKIGLSNWSNWDISNQVFVKLKDVEPVQLNTQLQQFSKAHLKPDFVKPELLLQPLADIHFNNAIGDEYSRKASLPVLSGLIAIAVFILLIAAINFVNLSTAQSVERSKEIGIRKVLGSNRLKLAFQFMSETFLLTVLATLLAVSMVNPLLRMFHSFVPSGLTFKIIDPQTIFFLVTITLVTSLLAGFYPAKILSSYLPALSLKGISSSPQSHEAYFRKSLIVFQFVVSLLFITGTLIVGQQIHFMLNKSLGFDKNAVVNIKTDLKESPSKRNFMVQKIKELPGVSMVSLSGKPPTADGQSSTMIWLNGDQKTEVEAQFIAADENFLPLYQIKLLAGSNYRHSDTINQLLINEAACKSFGFKKPEDALAKSVFMGISDRPNSSQTFPITAVVADFNSTSLHDPIKPLFIVQSSSMSNVLNIKFSASQNFGGAKRTLASIEKIWKQVYPGQTFEYRFFDESIASFYDKEQKTAQIINVAMVIAIFISCMGLFGLITFTTQQRTKEIGIRKTLGASVSNITLMFCKDFIMLVTLAVIISSPVAWLLLQRWLQNYPYRITIGIWPFVMAGLAALTIALITVSFQAVKAAIANPIKSLRSE